MSSAELLVPDVGRTVRRFGVAWRNRVQRSIHDVAVLDVNDGSYRFQYLDGVVSVDGFRSFIGFPALDRVYESPRLWPFFDLRVMDRRRPDYRQYVSWLGLAEDADRLDVLARNGGEQKGNTVSLAESPPVAVDGATTSTFIVRGSRFAAASFGSAQAICDLAPGDTLSVRPDKSNEANPDALLLTAGESPVGWTPDLLIEYAREVMHSGGTVTVLQNNGPEAPWHMRLLVQISGFVPPGWSAFTGGKWPAESPSLT